jgi:hypothetical protein
MWEMNPVKPRPTTVGGGLRWWLTTSHWCISPILDSSQSGTEAPRVGLNRVTLPPYLCPDPLLGPPKELLLCKLANTLTRPSGCITNPCGQPTSKV